MDELTERSGPLSPTRAALAAHDDIFPNLGAIVVVEVAVWLDVRGLLILNRPPVDESAGGQPEEGPSSFEQASG